MRIEWQIGFWIGAFLLLVLLLWLFSGVLLPFAAGGALGYLLNPLVDRLERVGFSRLSATLFIMACLVLVLALIFVLIVPFFGATSPVSSKPCRLCRQVGRADFGGVREPRERI